jgi:flavin reductase (DIM6/NTAB) family NADH-FMN oxidoreductase RutF
MANDSYYYEPAQGHGLPHDPFSAIIGPRPIGWISSQDSAGRLNLAPYSFFNAFNYQPPIIGFASVGRKDSLNNIEQSGEFTWNLVTRSLAEAMNQSSAAVAPEVDEFVLSQLTPTPSKLIATPRVLESPVSFECKLTQIVQLQSHAQRPIPTWLILGEVVAVHIAQKMLNNGIYDTAAAEPILRGGAADYFQISPQGRFSMQRP